MKFVKKNSAPKTEPTAEQKAAGKRVLKSGAYASILTAIVLVAVILVNLVAGAVPKKYTQFDISTSGLFTLSDTTKNALHSLQKDVTAYYLAETGSEDANITRMLDRYAGESSHFTWQQRDPAIYPTFAAQYNAQKATSGSVVLVCGDQSSVVDYSSMYETDYSQYYTTGSTTMSFAAESALTTGLSKVINENAYTLYQMTGHGETALESDFTTTLSNGKVTVQDLNMLTAPSVPEDAAAVLINCPQVDYTADTLDALRTYLNNGGALLVTTSLDAATPNLDGLLAEYGMSRQSGLLIENDTSHYAYRYSQTYLLPDITKNDVTGGMTSGVYAFTPVAQGIVTNTDSGMTFTTLLSTSSSAYAMQDYATAETAKQGDNDPTGSFPIAVAAQNTENKAKVVWINCGNVFVSNINQMVSGGNAQLLGSIVNWMNGEENAVVIDSKSMSATTLTVPSGAILGFGLLFVILLPVALIVLGIVIYILRRRK